MKNIVSRILRSDLEGVWNNRAILFFRVFISLELIIVHGLKKIGVGVMQAEMIPNPMGLPEVLNSVFAISANIVFPLFIIVGFFTRVAIVPVLAVTLTGYFVVHGSDSLLEKDVPFMYSVSYLLLFILGAGKYSIDAKLS
ncbi:MAG: DoxX family protein [Flavobacterium sp.]|nr:DoxX family protein [Flavobacterium sp.]